MKFQVKTDDLLGALRIVNMALPAKTAAPIFECVLMDVEDGTLTLTGSDSQVTASVSVPVEDWEGGCAAIRGKLLDDFARRLTDPSVRFEVDAKNTFRVRSGRAHSRLAGMSAVDYPQRPDFEPETRITLPADELCRSISAVEPCVARDDMRQVLTGSCLDVRDGRISLVGLDGYRMGVCGLGVSACPEDTQVIIPIKSLNIVTRLLATAGEDLIDLNFSKQEFGLSFGSARLRCSLIEGQYVNWRAIVPKDYKTAVTVDGAQFRQTIDRAALIARLGQNSVARLSIRENDGLTVAADSGLDSLRESLDASVTGPELDISFNVAFLGEAAKMFGDGTVTLRFNNPNGPCVVSAGETLADFYWLILPVRS